MSRCRIVWEGERGSCTPSCCVSVQCVCRCVVLCKKKVECRWVKYFPLKLGQQCESKHFAVSTSTCARQAECCKQWKARQCSALFFGLRPMWAQSSVFLHLSIVETIFTLWRIRHSECWLAVVQDLVNSSQSGWIPASLRDVQYEFRRKQCHTGC